MILEFVDDKFGIKKYLVCFNENIKKRACIIGCKCFRMVHNLENVFCYIIFIQFLTSAVVICNIGFLLVHVSNKTKYFFHSILKFILQMDNLNTQFFRVFMYFLAMMIQLVVYCWYGNEIIIKVSIRIFLQLSLIWQIAQLGHNLSRSCRHFPNNYVRSQ